MRFSNTALVHEPSPFRHWRREGLQNCYGASHQTLYPQRNIEYEIYLCRQARQQPQETLDQFATRLRQFASHCEFASVDKEIKSQIILSRFSSRLRRRALGEPTITLKSLLELGRAMELSET